MNASDRDLIPQALDINFRVTESGDYFSLEFVAEDGKPRAVALPSVACVKMIAGLIWTAAEAGRRRPAPAIAEPVRTQIREDAPYVSAAAVGSPPGELDPVLELTVGVAPFAVRLPRLLALELAEALVIAVQQSQPRQ